MVDRRDLLSLDLTERSTFMVDRRCFAAAPSVSSQHRVVANFEDPTLHRAIVSGHLGGITAAGPMRRPAMTIVFDRIHMRAHRVAGLCAQGLDSCSQRNRRPTSTRPPRRPVG